MNSAGASTCPPLTVTFIPSVKSSSLNGPSSRPSNQEVSGFKLADITLSDAPNILAASATASSLLAKPSPSNCPRSGSWFGLRMNSCTSHSLEGWLNWTKSSSNAYQVIFVPLWVFCFRESSINKHVFFIPICPCIREVFSSKNLSFEADLPIG